jgi:hypothetical protein
LPVYFNLNFTETREAVNFTTQYGNGVQIMNETLGIDNLELESGDNLILNETETREINFVVNGKNPDKAEIRMQGLKCISGTCPRDDVDDETDLGDPILWSNAINWVGGVLPVEGDDVVIAAN